MNYSLVSLKTSKLNKNKIIQISNLKDSQWRFGINSQIEWFKKNIKKNDIHNMFYFKSQIIGYTLLRIRSCKINTIIKKYLLFDTLILKKSFRKKKISSLLMNFNNELIKLNNKFSFLICEKKMINFYKKFNWKTLEKKKFNFLANNLNKNGMVFNQTNLFNKNNFKIEFFDFK